MLAEGTSELQVAVFAGDDVIVHALPRDGRVTIGRADDNDLKIDNPSVSRHHAVLHIGPPLRIQDLGGANGTFVREPHEPSTPGDTQDLRQLSGATLDVVPGDCIVLGTAMIVVRRIARPPRFQDELAGPPSSRGGDVVIREPSMLALYDQARRAAQSPISVLVLGETGVGKEVLAQAIHRSSPRSRGPLLGLNCAALSESLLESELFGHEKGAFTGALQTRPGLFESAAGGTVFLDEVGELPMSMQVKLLRVIEERKVLRVGSRTPRDVDVRFVAATNRDLEAESEAGRFRQDLFFRLNGIALTIPPLRERPAEILALAEVFLAGACRQIDRLMVPSLSPKVAEVLQRHAWPGNVRELRNAIDRAVVLCAGDTVLPEHLPTKLVNAAAAARPAATPAVAQAAPDAPRAAGDAGSAMDQLRAEMAELERKRIIDALEKCAGNQTQAAELLGISRRTLVTRLGELGLPRPRKKS